MIPIIIGALAIATATGTAIAYFYTRGTTKSVQPVSKREEIVKRIIANGGVKVF
jgi:hypothetical protein